MDGWSELWIKRVNNDRIRAHVQAACLVDYVLWLSLVDVPLIVEEQKAAQTLDRFSVVQLHQDSPLIILVVHVAGCGDGHPG